MFCNKKEMSFLKINDPLKRDAIVKEYLELKKKIRSNFLSERVGEQQLQTDLSKFYKPITETQKATTREITEGLKPITETQKATTREIIEGLKPIREGIEKLPKTIVFPTTQPIGEASGKEEEKEKKEYIPSPKTLGEKAYEYLHGKEYQDRDMSFGIHLGTDGNYYMGATKSPNSGNYRVNSGKMLTIGYENIIVDNEKFKGTDGLWELIMKNKPDPTIYKKEDLDTYGRLLLKTNVLHHNFDSENPHPRSSESYKWKYILNPIWHNRENIRKKEVERTAEKEVAKTDGKGVVVIPSDPNALLERLDLLLASQEAGHTGVRNELVSICDELKRQGVLNTKAYKKLNHIIKK